MTARERIAALCDQGSALVEMGLFAAWKMYDEFGGAPSAAVVTGIGRVDGSACMIIANDATVKAGAFFPLTAKKVLRAQRIAHFLINRGHLFIGVQRARAAPVVLQIVDSPCGIRARVLFFVTITAFVSGAGVRTG